VRAEDALGAFADALPVVATGRRATARPGSAGSHQRRMPPWPRFAHAVADVQGGRASAIVTNPIAKSACSTAPVSGIPATPNFSPNLPPPAAPCRSR